MTQRELLQAAMRHEEGEVPAWTMAFFNLELAKVLVGADDVPLDYQPTPEFKTGGADADARARNLRYARATGNCAIAVGRGGNFAFGHGGPGEMMEKLVSENATEVVSAFETGVKRVTKRNPHYYRHFDYPLKSLDALDALELPDAESPARYEGVREDADFYRNAGFLPYANLNGLFSGAHYYLYPYEDLLMDMLLEPDAVRALLSRLSRFNLTAAEALLRQGVEMITACDDMGDGTSLLFSPECYETFFHGYYCELASLCHAYGAALHLHSHGNILRILPRLVETGVDVLNPFDPFEVGDLAAIKEAYGARVTIAGGMHRFFFSWTREEMRAAMRDTVALMRRGGGYVWMDNGGIPTSVRPADYAFYRDLMRETLA